MTRDWLSDPDVSALREALVTVGRLSSDSDEDATGDAVIVLLEDFARYLKITGQHLPPRPSRMSVDDFMVAITADMLSQWVDTVLHENWDPLRTTTTH
jgi:hypothetical protein